MDVKAQRAAGLRMAVKANADRTKTAIKDEDSCYETIFKAAIEDIGLDKTVANILVGDPEWASQMLQHVSDLGSHREALIQKATESPATALQVLRKASDLGEMKPAVLAAAGTQAASLGKISAMRLKDSAGFDCSFTLYWERDGIVQVAETSGDTIWSSTILLGQSTIMACRSFSLTKTPLQDGDEVWMFVSVKSGNKHNESKLRFTYDSQTVQCADLVVSGTTTDNSLAFSGFSSAAPVVNVSIADNKVTCAPDVVEVHRRFATGIQWKMATNGYQFTGIQVSGDHTQDFSDPVFTENNTVMTVTDTVADLEDYTYTIEYKADNGDTGSFDPGIKNIR